MKRRTKITFILIGIIVLSFLLREHLVLARWITAISALICMAAIKFFKFLIGDSATIFYLLVTGIFLYIIIKYFVRRSKRSNSLKAIKYINTFFILFILCILVFGTAERQIFTPDKWRVKEESRKHMITNMVDKTDLINQKKDEVVSILGQPDDESKRNNKHYIVYFIGYMVIDDDQLYLVVEFDENENVKGYEVNPYGSI